MEKDPRIDLIIKSINVATSEVNPGSPPFEPSEDDLQGIVVCLKLFDLLLPSVMDAYIKEFYKQEGAA